MYMYECRYQCPTQLQVTSLSGCYVYEFTEQYSGSARGDCVSLAVAFEEYTPTLSQEIIFASCGWKCQCHFHVASCPSQ